MSFQCQECHQSFPYKRNLTRHIKTVHGNKPRKDNEARKEGLLAGLYSETFEAQVESVPHAWTRTPLGARSGDPDLPGFPLKRRSRSKS